MLLVQSQEALADLTSRNVALHVSGDAPDVYIRGLPPGTHLPPETRTSPNNKSSWCVHPNHSESSHPSSSPLYHPDLSSHFLFSFSFLLFFFTSVLQPLLLAFNPCLPNLSTTQILHILISLFDYTPGIS